MEWTEGKKGNIRALLGTLHTVIWEGSGWNCNLSNLVTYADVKKAYRKACLAVHPDKVVIYICEDHLYINKLDSRQLS